MDIEKGLSLREYSLSEMISREYPVSQPAIDALEKQAVAWQCDKGEIISAQQEPCQKWIFISCGVCRISFEKNGKEDTLVFGGSGEIYTSFNTLVCNRDSLYQLQALTPCKGWEISHRKFSLLQDRFPDLIKFERNYLRQQMLAFEDLYWKRAMTTPAERYEEFWKNRADILKALSPQTLSRYIPLKVIAQYLSMTPQMLSILRRREVDNNKTPSHKKA